MPPLYTLAAVLTLPLATLALIGCSNAPPQTAAQRGQRVYASNCVVCHHPDPSQPGSQGPAIMGSSRELLEARVLRSAYPPGYRPKRTTHAMPAMPYLASKIDDLAAFLRNGAP